MRFEVDYTHRALGMLLGHHCGDALGATNEFAPASEVWNANSEITGGGRFQWGAGESTSDTDLMMCVLKGLSDEHSFSLELVVEEFKKWGQNPKQDCGKQTLAALQRISQGLFYLEADSSSIASNGSLMRVAPMAMLNMPEPELEQWVKKQTMLTHPHPDCIVADWVLIKGLRAALQGESKATIYQEMLHEAQRKSPALAELFQKMPQVEWQSLKTDGHCFHSLSAAVWALLNFKTFEDSLIAVVNRGGDSDTAGAITGALAGAFYSVEEIPQRWLAKLSRRSEIVFELESLFPWKGPSFKPLIEEKSLSEE